MYFMSHGLESLLAGLVFEFFVGPTKTPDRSSSGPDFGKAPVGANARLAPFAAEIGKVADWRKRQIRAKRACASPSEAMVSQKCISCGRLGVRRQEMQRHARRLIGRGVSVAEANKPRCNRCVQKLLSTSAAAAVTRR
jgi:hypothetical protein